jgi:hypothetical protein
MSRLTWADLLIEDITPVWQSICAQSLSSGTSANMGIKRTRLSAGR